MGFYLPADVDQHVLQSRVHPLQQIHIYPLQVGDDLFEKRSSGTLYGQIKEIDIERKYVPREPAFGHQLVQSSGRYRISGIVHDPVLLQVDAEIPGAPGEPDNLVVWSPDGVISRIAIEIQRFHGRDIEEKTHIVGKYRLFYGCLHCCLF